MEKFIIYGGEPLNGDVNISGMKNSALPILFGTILTQGTCIIDNLPDISDVKDSLAILQSVGASIIAELINAARNLPVTTCNSVTGNVINVSIEPLFFSSE